MIYPLSGIRVIEVDAGVALATTGMLLRDAGAEVIKLEPPSGDASRGRPGHHGWNRGKRSVMLDPADPRRNELLATADVILARRRPDAYARAAGQVIALSPPYGEAPGYSALPEDDALASALAGVLGGTGAYRPGPAYPVIPTLSYAAGAALAGAVAAALRVRAQTGQGQELSVPWPTIGAYLSAYQASESDRVPFVPGAGGSSPQGLSIGWRAYQAADGWVGVACPNPMFFNRLMACIDRAELLSDSRFAMAPFVGPEHRDALLEILAGELAKRTRAQWTERFAEFGVPGAALLGRDEFVESDLVRENGMMALVDDPMVGKVRQVARPFSIGSADLPGAAPAPRLGADTASVMAETRPAAARPPAAPARLPAHPLAGIRVLDFTGYLAGPTAGRLLVELGAEVIKVEPPEGEGFRGAGLSCAGINIGKKSIALDSRAPEGREVLERLMRSADVLLHALIPGAPEKMGLDYDSVRKVNPKLVYCWISGFGQAKAWRGRPSFDLLLQALSGQMFTLGNPSQPVYSSIPMADLYAGMMAAYAIVLGLSLRDRDGEGRAVSTNQVASSMAAQQGEFVRFEGMPAPGPDANALGASAVCRYYRAADGWAMLAARDAMGWTKVAAALGLESRWSDWTVAAGEPAEGALADAIGAALGALSRRSIKERLSLQGAPCVPVVIVREDRIGNEYFRDLDVLRDGIEHHRFGRITTVADFYRFSLTPSLVPGTAQWVGDQNAEVLALAGYTKAEAAALAASGVVAAPELRIAGI